MDTDEGPTISARVGKSLRLPRDRATGMGVLAESDVLTVAAYAVARHVEAGYVNPKEAA